jgi:hypothetical protein
VSFADMISNLVIFFILMATFGAKNAANAEQSGGGKDANGGVLEAGMDRRDVVARTRKSGARLGNGARDPSERRETATDSRFDRFAQDASYDVRPGIERLRDGLRDPHRRRTSRRSRIMDALRIREDARRRDRQLLPRRGLRFHRRIPRRFRNLEETRSVERRGRVAGTRRLRRRPSLRQLRHRRTAGFDRVFRGREARDRQCGPRSDARATVASNSS